MLRLILPPIGVQSGAHNVITVFGELQQQLIRLMMMAGNKNKKRKNRNRTEKVSADLSTYSGYSGHSDYSDCSDQIIQIIQIQIQTITFDHLCRFWHLPDSPKDDL